MRFEAVRSEDDWAIWKVLDTHTGDYAKDPDGGYEYDYEGSKQGASGYAMILEQAQ